MKLRVGVLVVLLALVPVAATFAQGASGGNTVDMMWITWVGSIAALLFALYQAVSVLKKDPGTDAMQEISKAVQEGAMAYLKQQYSVVGIVFVALFVLLAILSFGFRFISPFVPFAFITGGFFSGLSGFIGMSIATRANCRTAAAAKDSLNAGLRVAFSAGTVMGMTVVGLGLLDLSIWWTLLRYVFQLPDGEIPPIMITFGMGASSMALFARVGGGIFTKAADVGADLVGKVETGIPEDDPRNPAVIADNVGDNVGDVAGMGADLYESYVGAIVATMALGAIGSMSIPEVSRAAGHPGADLHRHHRRHLLDHRELLRARQGRRLPEGAAARPAHGRLPLDRPHRRLLLPLRAGSPWARSSSGSGAPCSPGLLAGNVIGYSTEYFTSDSYKPTQEPGQRVADRTRPR